MTGTCAPQEVCSFRRVMGWTTELRSGCSRVARSVPRADRLLQRPAVQLHVAADLTLKIGMPVSWQSRLSVRSATPMFSIIVARIDLGGAVGLAGVQAGEALLDVVGQHLQRADVEQLGGFLDRLRRDAQRLDSGAVISVMVDFPQITSDRPETSSRPSSTSGSACGRHAPVRAQAEPAAGSMRGSAASDSISALAREEPAGQQGERSDACMATMKGCKHARACVLVAAP